MRFDHPAIQALAQKYQKEPAHILLRYSLQKGYVAIPKTSSQKRVVSNTNIFDFELSEDEVIGLDGLDEGNDRVVIRCTLLIPRVGLVTDWDPTTCP